MVSLRWIVCAVALGFAPAISSAQLPDLEKLSPEERANIIKKLETRLEQLKKESVEVSNMLQKVKNLEPKPQVKKPEGDKKPEAKKPEGDKKPELKKPEQPRGPMGPPPGFGPLPGFGPPGGFGPPAGGFGGEFGNRPPGVAPMGGFGGGFGGMMRAPEPEAMWNMIGGNEKDKLKVEDNRFLKQLVERGTLTAKEGVVTKDQFIREMKKYRDERANPPRPEGRPMPEGDRRPEGRPMPEGDRRPEGRPMPREGDRRPEGGERRPEGRPMPPEAGRRPEGPPPGSEIRELNERLNRLERALEELRRELRNKK